MPPTVTRASDGANDAPCTFTVTAGDGGGGGPGGGGGGAGGGLTSVLSLPPHASIKSSNPSVTRMLYDSRVGVECYEAHMFYACHPRVVHFEHTTRAFPSQREA